MVCGVLLRCGFGVISTSTTMVVVVVGNYECGNVNGMNE